jgi:hypothetical protein
LVFATQADDDDDQGLLEVEIPFFGSGIGRNQEPVINGKEEVRI